MPVSTPSRCLRSESLWTHSSTSSHASSRVGDMRGRLSTRRPEPGKHMSFVTLATSRMEKFIIEGGTPLSGTVVPAGNKNAALPALAACLLTAEPVVLHNVPQIRDTENLLELLEALGVKVERSDGNTIRLQADEIRTTDVDTAL